MRTPIPRTAEPVEVEGVHRLPEVEQHEVGQVDHADRSAAAPPRQSAGSAAMRAKAATSTPAQHEAAVARDSASLAVIVIAHGLACALKLGSSMPFHEAPQRAPVDRRKFARIAVVPPEVRPMRDRLVVDLEQRVRRSRALIDERACTGCGRSGEHHDARAARRSAPARFSRADHAERGLAAQLRPCLILAPGFRNMQVCRTRASRPRCSAPAATFRAPQTTWQGLVAEPSSTFAPRLSLSASG
jgi:ferredoxin